MEAFDARWAPFAAGVVALLAAWAVCVANAPQLVSLGMLLAPGLAQ